MTDRRQSRAHGGIPIRQGGDRPNDRFVILANANVRNAQLPGVARAVHAYLLSLPEGWHVTADLVAEEGFPLDSRERVRRAFRDLRAEGFLLLKQERGERGRLASWYEVYHDPQPAGDQVVPLPSSSPRTRKPASPQAAPGAVFPAAGGPAAGSTAHIKKKTKPEDHHQDRRHPSWLCDALPGLDDDQIAEIKERINARHSPKNLMGYLRDMAKSGDLVAYGLGCGRVDPDSAMSEACKSGDGSSCGYGWCRCRCHAHAVSPQGAGAQR